MLEKVFEAVKKLVLRLKDVKKQNLVLEEQEGKSTDLLGALVQDKNDMIQERYRLELDMLRLQKEINLKNLELKQKKIVKGTLTLQENKITAEQKALAEETQQSRNAFQDYLVKLKIVGEETQPLKKDLQDLYQEHKQLKKGFQGMCKGN